MDYYNPNRSTDTTSSVIGFLVLMAILITALVGYIMNVIWVFTADGGVTTHFIVGIVGLFLAPVGIINGLFFT